VNAQRQARHTQAGHGDWLGVAAPPKRRASVRTCAKVLAGAAQDDASAACKGGRGIVAPCQPQHMRLKAQTPTASKRGATPTVLQ